MSSPSTTTSKATTKPPRLTVHASHIAAAHTYLAFAAFLTALFLGCVLHYKKIVKNGVAGYPQEWWPSVSATIGDWYPERSIFHILIALTSGPRFALVFLQYYLSRPSHPTLSTVVFISGLVRTLSCGGWVYITSEDDHDAHDVLMITYMVCNLPWMLGNIQCTPVVNGKARRRRQIIAGSFFGALVPLVYFFIQHKVHRIAGAYTYYSLFEWALIFLDVSFDSVAELDFRAADLQFSIGLSLHNINEKDEIVSIPAQIASEKTSTTTEHLVLSSSNTTATGPVASSESTVDETTPVSVGSRFTPFIEATNLYRPVTSFIADLYLSYIRWSIYTSLAPTLFYFSVWELGIAGSELALLSVLSPVFLGISPILRWARSRAGRTTLHAVSLTGLAAYILNSPGWRLIAVMLANVAVSIGWAVDWAVPSDAGYQATVAGLGLILSSLSKHANHSNNPVWPIVDARSGGYNKTGIILALLALYEAHTRQPPISTTPPVAASTKASSKASTAQVAPQTPNPHWFFSAAALGSLIFTLHRLLADPSTLIAWSWTGYPISGPVPSLHGSLTHLAQASGLLLALSSTSAGLNAFLRSPAWFACGAGSLFVLYMFKDWTGYFGGLGYSLFLMSVLPQVMLAAATASIQNVGKTYFTMWVVVCLFLLADVWTVAYAFVPGGVYLRERTDLVLVAQMVCLVPAFGWANFGLKNAPMSVPESIRTYSRYTLALLSVLSVLATLYRLPTDTPHPHKPGPKIVTAGIWTVHFGIDNEGRDSQRRMRDLIKDMQLDVVGLLETDLHRIVYGNRDLTRVIAEDLGYYVDLGSGPNQHTWGAVLLSKFPILRSIHHLLPSPHGELAPCIEAVLDMYGTNVTVLVAHNGQEEDPLDRELQSKELARIMAASYPDPVIFLGYVVTDPGALRPAPYEIMVADGRVHDVDKEDRDRWCEYIFYRGLYRTSYARVSRGTITDTELQIAQFVVPKYGFGVTNDTDSALYLRAWKENLPEAHWLPMSYYGNEENGGVRGHYYHVFNTPLYYQIPEGAVL